MAAVLAGESLSQEATLSNRLWGGLSLVGGVLEMTGAAALCVLPEPTMTSKVGCIVFGVHGSDVAGTGLKQIWTGQDTRTLVQQGTAKLAETMRVSPDLADNIGLSLDIAVPVGLSSMVGAVRATSIQLGRISLMQHEARVGTSIGGHTIAKHVGRTEQQLRARLKAETKIKVASSFRDMKAAEWAISQAMKADAMRIKAWVQSSGSKLEIVHDVGVDVGYGVVRATGAFVKMRKVKMFLKREIYNGMPYYILTAYLEI
ncbi:RNase A-like domain-containing protein [Ralstonia sp. 25C]|uniref:RNase A-like domain-containing protein n=1 Tax=Ralstonia sp. 25C TaxID=3447363 RepID=UPI003F750028